jgi:hypothetical protein
LYNKSYKVRTIEEIMAYDLIRKLYSPGEGGGDMHVRSTPASYTPEGVISVLTRCLADSKDTPTLAGSVDTKIPKTTLETLTILHNGLVAAEQEGMLKANDNIRGLYNQVVNQVIGISRRTLRTLLIKASTETYNHQRFIPLLEDAKELVDNLVAFGIPITDLNEPSHPPMGKHAYRETSDAYNTLLEIYTRIAPKKEKPAADSGKEDGKVSAEKSVDPWK